MSNSRSIACVIAFLGFSWMMCAFAGVGSAASPLPLAVPDADNPPPIPAEEQPETLTSGPVHEAFAEPVNTDVQEGLVVPKEPPASIEELPPADRPQGENYIWVPGYWAWDADRSGYLWVSACWRLAPPNMTWVPGYWNRISGGWEWVAGLWTPAGAQEIEYLPAPPALDNIQPLMDAPVGTVWVPPCWYVIKPEKVKVPASPVHAKPEVKEKDLPRRPADEEKRRG